LRDAKKPLRGSESALQPSETGLLAAEMQLRDAPTGPHCPEIRMRGPEMQPRDSKKLSFSNLRLNS
jgi:hypothetical protein